MEPEQTSCRELSGQLENLNKVTPLSKYLAMALFIVLPFVGGWIGYTLAPEKVVEKILPKEASVEIAENISVDIPNSSVTKPTLPGDWTTYNNDEVSFIVSYPYGYDSVITNGNNGGTNEPSFHLFDDSLPEVKIFRESITGMYCFDGLCERGAQTQKNINDITWDYIGESVYCDAGSCTSESRVYRTFRENYRYYLFVETGSEDIETGVLSSFMFKNEG